LILIDLGREPLWLWCRVDPFNLIPCYAWKVEWTSIVAPISPNPAAMSK
jgi:hypothetical protein